MISKNPLLQLVTTYRNNLLINRCNVNYCVCKLLYYSFSFLCTLGTICNIVIYFLLVLTFVTVTCVLEINDY